MERCLAAFHRTRSRIPRFLPRLRVVDLPLVPVISLVLVMLAAVTVGPSSASGDAPRPASSDVSVRGPARTVSLVPAARISHPRIEECSGIAWSGGAWWVHNDSGDEPVLYRSTNLDFRDAEVLVVPGAEATDWEDMTEVDSDLVVGDIGDNLRRRPYLTLYRVRYETGGLRLVGSWRYRYPDGPHDAEAILAIDGEIVVVSKAREEKTTGVYRFGDLLSMSPSGGAPDTTVLVPRRTAYLEIGDGEQVTGGTFHPGTRTVVLLTYTRILEYPADRLEGEPARATPIAARQSEAICFRGDHLVVANEQRDLFVFPEFLHSPRRPLLPTRGAAELPLTPDLWCDLTLMGMREGEWLRWSAAGETLRVEGRFEADEDEIVPTLFGQTSSPSDAASSGGEGDEPRDRIGSSVLLLFGREPNLQVGPDEVELAVGSGENGVVAVWAIDLTGDRLRLAPDRAAVARGRWTGTVFEFRAEIPLARIFPDGLPDRFLFDARTFRMREEEARFTGMDEFSLLRPYTWGEVRVVR